MVHQDVLQDYSESIKRIRDQCLDSGMSEEEFRNVYFDSLQSINNTNDESSTSNTNTNGSVPHLKKYKWLLVVTFVLACLAYHRQIIYSCIFCQLQEYIYPGLRLLRKLAIPIVTLFPSITDLYHETCLVQNPFFTVVDMDCWPCSSINNVREIANPVPSTQHNGPFIYETSQQVINFEKLKDIFESYKNTFTKEPSKIYVNNKNHITPNEMFTSNNIGEHKLYVWKLNNMNLARVFRQFIPRPIVVPKFGQSTERFIIIDSSQSLYKVPDTECNYSFLLSLSGSRMVKLLPAEECKHQCKSLKVELKEQYLLWYNWWYWRPEIQPSHSNETFIGHVGSYC